ncbi:MAG: preprotein translocase subunit SecG [Gemmatimonadota bacterium]
MFGLTFAVLLTIGVLLMVVVLLQAGKGGGLAAMGGANASTDSVLGGRQAATLLTKLSWWFGGSFLVLALVLSIMSSRGTAPTSVLQDEFQNGAAAPTPVLPGAVAPAEDGAAPTEPPAQDGDDPGGP